MNIYKFFEECRNLTEEGWTPHRVSNVVHFAHPVFGRMDPVSAIWCNKNKKMMPDLMKHVQDREVQWSAAARMLQMPRDVLIVVLNKLPPDSPQWARNGIEFTPVQKAA